MTSRKTIAVSLLYDTLLFAILVSLSAAALLPAITTNITTTTSLETHRELEVKDTLHALLATRPDNFSYTFAGIILDTTASHLGIDTTSPGLYKMIKDWILTNTPQHETLASLLAEDLASQLQVPTGPHTTIALNPLTSDLDAHLKATITTYLTARFQGRYLYNLTARWQPIIGIPFGGSLSIGPHPPRQTSHVATHLINIPIPPAIHLGNTTLILTHHALAHYFTQINLSTNTTIPQITNLSLTLNAYLHHTQPYANRTIAQTSLTENLTSLLDGILLTGLTNATTTTIFPGIANATITNLFTKINALFTNLTTELLNDSLSGLLTHTHTILSDLNTTTPRLTDWLLAPFNTSLSTLLNTTFPTLPDALNTTKTWALTHLTTTTHTLLAPPINSFTNLLLNTTDALDTLHTLLTRWILDRLQIQSATITLTIWTMQP